MRQRLGLAQAIMEDPQLLILDEPTNGLDFDGQREIYSCLVQLRNPGKSILITSHNRDEIKVLCDRAFTLSGGKLLEDLTVREFNEVEGIR
jgi:ABC-2 type transport system ATP-binding protein